MQTILLIEDNEEIKKGLDYLLFQNDYLLLWAKNLEMAESMIKEKEFDLILLDITLPDGNGFDFFKNNKNAIHVPVIFLTAKDLEDDIVSGLELGASDYIVKPFHNRELILRIKNALKNSINEKIVYINDIVIYKDRMKVYKKEKEIPLTSLEYKIFSFLIENKNRVVTRENLFNYIWDDSSNYVNDNTLTVYIKRIREKLEDESIIKTIKGIGYRVEENEK